MNGPVSVGRPTGVPNNVFGLACLWVIWVRDPVAGVELKTLLVAGELIRADSFSSTFELRLGKAAAPDPFVRRIFFLGGPICSWMSVSLLLLENCFSAALAVSKLLTGAVSTLHVIFLQLLLGDLEPALTNASSFSSGQYT